VPKRHIRFINRVNLRVFISKKNKPKVTISRRKLLKNRDLTAYLRLPKPFEAKKITIFISKNRR